VGSGICVSHHEIITFRALVVYRDNLLLVTSPTHSALERAISSLNVDRLIMTVVSGGNAHFDELDSRIRCLSF
jgi:hypothetical protein